jgi:hypothetical protein
MEKQIDVHLIKVDAQTLYLNQGTAPIILPITCYHFIKKQPFFYYR